MSLTTFHTFEHEGKKYRFVYDEDYTVERACGGVRACIRKFHTDESEEECDKFYREDCEALESGRHVALGVIVSEPCPGPAHCAACDGVVEDDSLWGIVIENSNAAAEQFVKDGEI